ncbi:uncharacterized protein FOKN1_0170 [Thiohalobacter thiocyanaticus]|uniref:Uncharacterized protein n=1 Tax=Thiohalobacter thiocyanaticus TaxID=585455 RepID=A0A1Z4VMX6_9GAMM|nr:tetratricopeptide repeat protein [Thiohalobacter thiocyanaticus]BAZ92574.1 uncharacterized protein FOKN1_0170 [Thiohalobacter thiocyanaticus]
MSLVNQVLRDLDARREAQPLDAALEGLRSAPPATRSAHKAGIALGTLVLLGLVGTLAWVYLQPPQQSTVTSERPRPAAVEAPVAQPALPLRPAADISALSSPAPATAVHAGAVVDNAHPASTGVSPSRAEPAVPTTPSGTTAAEPARHDATAPTAATAATAAIPNMRKTARPLSAAEVAEQHFAEGVAALEQGQWRLAERGLQAALQVDPDHLQARESLSGVLLYQGRQREAEQVLAAGLERRPLAPSLAQPYARLILDQGRDDAAIEVLETALVNAVNDADYLALLAGVYQRNQRYADADASYRSALSLAPQRAAWWLGLGLALEGSGELPRAAGAYRSAIENPGLNPDARRYAEQRLQRLNHLLGRQ